MQCAPIVTFAWKSSLASHFPTIQTFTSQPVSGSRLPLTRRRTSTPSSSTGSQARAKFELFTDWVSRNIETCRHFGQGQGEWGKPAKVEILKILQIKLKTAKERIEHINDPTFCLWLTLNRGNQSNGYHFCLGVMFGESVRSFFLLANKLHVGLETIWREQAQVHLRHCPR